jgi:hypothetical protein
MGLATGASALVGWRLTAPQHQAVSVVEFEGLFAPNNEAREAGAYEFFETQKLIASSHSVCLAAADTLLEGAQGRRSSHKNEPSSRMSVATNIRGELRVQRVPGSRALRLTFKHQDEAYAREVVDAVVRAYLQRVEALRPVSGGSSAAEFDMANLQVERADSALREFVKAQDAPLSDQYVELLSAELSQYTQALTASRVRAIELGAEVAQLEAAISKKSLSVPELRRDQAFNVFRNRAAELQMERVTAAARGDAAAKLEMVDAQLRLLAYEMSEHARSVLDTTKAELSLVREQQRQITAEMERLRIAIKELHLHRLELARLQRQLDVQRKRFEAQMGQAVEEGRASMRWSAREVDRSVDSVRRFPWWAWIAAGVGLGLLVSGAIMLRIATSRRPIANHSPDAQGGDPGP